MIRVFPVVILAGFKRSQLCLRLNYDSGVLGRIAPERGCSRLCLRLSYERISAASETAHRYTRPFKRAAQSTRRARPAAGLRPTDPCCHSARRHGSTCASTTARVP